jgi:hypothetical protein
MSVAMHMLLVVTARHAAATAHWTQCVYTKPMGAATAVQAATPGTVVAAQVGVWLSQLYERLLGVLHSMQLWPEILPIAARRTPHHQQLLLHCCLSKGAPCVACLYTDNLSERVTSDAAWAEEQLHAIQRYTCSSGNRWSVALAFLEGFN